MALLEIQNLKKYYTAPDGERSLVLAVNEFELEPRASMALQGASGTGKTTFLHLIGGILRADEGAIRIAGQDLTTLSEARRDAFRATHLGYVFQSFHLLQGYTALENVVLGMTFGPGPDKEFARHLLERLGLADRLTYRPSQLSVGQQQRVAVARALANRPQLVLADEPTGNLDPVRAREALELLLSVCEENEAALLVVSHDPAILGQLPRVVSLAELNQASQEGAAP